MKKFTLFIALFTLIVTFATFTTAEQSIHVSSPGPGPWAIKSVQSCSWWSVDIDPDEAVLVEIVCKGTGKVVFSGEGKCGPATDGHLDFKVGDWDVDDSYFAVVSLKSKKECKGTGGKFKIFKTEEYGGYKKDY